MFIQWDHSLGSLMCGARLCFVSQTLPNFIHRSSRWGAWRSRWRKRNVDWVPPYTGSLADFGAPGYILLRNWSVKTQKLGQWKGLDRPWIANTATDWVSWGNNVCLRGSGFSSGSLIMWLCQQPQEADALLCVKKKKKRLRYGSRRASATCTSVAEAPLAPRRAMNSLKVLTECLNRD